MRPVYQALNKPLTLLGVERKLFFVVLTLAAAMFNVFGALFPSIGLFIALWLAARAATRTDPQILQILVSSRRFGIRYDPAKW
jgi:type IV secretory pathway TrbD component